MKLRDFVRFITDKLVVTLLLLVLAEINAIILLPKEISISLPIVLFLGGSIVLFKQYSGEKSQEKLTVFKNKLYVLVEEFKDKIVAPNYSYSLPSIGSMIANDNQIMNKTEAWYHLFLMLSADLSKKANELDAEIKQSKGEQFSSLLEEFSELLSSLETFKREFYNMINETRNLANYGVDAQFGVFYNKFREEYNGYMDRLRSFSDDLKAEKMGVPLREDLIEHIGDLSELYRVVS